eukprot:COSAG02_NODE_969_length_15565_cov_9.614833_3_plen_132_part_00
MLGVSRQLAPAEIDEEAIALETRYISCWGQFAWHGEVSWSSVLCARARFRSFLCTRAWSGDPNGVQTEQAVSSETMPVHWPRRGVDSQVYIFDTPTCRVGGVNSLPGETLWKWLTENELHEKYTLAKARIL